ncbi:MAG: hypothetical protein LBB52_07375 [Desulfovibrio sp.]|nr:hypothetical protein [Desulfovibrio sp.]
MAENARFLSGRVAEIGLCFFEWRACLAYTDADVPPELAKLPFSWHVHLPCDLPWPARPGPDGAACETAEQALAVFARAAFLAPRCAVLHPPQGAPAFKRRLLRDFARTWQRGRAVPLLLENLSGCDIVELGDGFLQDHGLGLCLDVGHLLGYGQKRLLSSALPETADLVHWSAPGGGDEHLPLTALTSEQLGTAAELAARFAGNPVHLAEIFHWPGVEASLPVLEELTGGRYSA